MSTITLEVGLNGNGDRYPIVTLPAAPFPDGTRTDEMCRHLAVLDKVLIPDEDSIRNHLLGWDEVFVNFCCAQFRAGGRVRFTVVWHEGTTAHVRL
jgi:hypothetical protein